MDVVNVLKSSVISGICIGVALGAAYSANTKKEENKKDKE